MVKKYIKRAHTKSLNGARFLKHHSLKTSKKALKRTLAFKKEFRKEAVTAVVAAFGFLIALSWRDFISDTINKIVSVFGVSEQLYLYKLLTAVLVTVLAILGILAISKLQVKEEEKEQEEQKEITKLKKK